MQHKNKPTKDPFIKFYILWPIQDLLESIVDFFRWIWRTLSGAWWCDHCNKYHGRRVHKYLMKSTLLDSVVCAILSKPAEDKWVCSLWRDAQEQKEKLDPSTAAQDLLDTKAKWEAQLKHDNKEDLAT